MFTSLFEIAPVLAAVLSSLVVVFGMGTVFVVRWLPRLSRTHHKREVELIRARNNK
jgi:hypothetical protein